MLMHADSENDMVQVVTCKETLDIISRMSHEGLDDHRVQLMSRIEEIAGAIADRKVDAGSAWHYEFAERVRPKK